MAGVGSVEGPVILEYEGLKEEAMPCGCTECCKGGEHCDGKLIIAVAVVCLGIHFLEHNFA